MRTIVVMVVLGVVWGHQLVQGGLISSNGDFLGARALFCELSDANNATPSQHVFIIAPHEDGLFHAYLHRQDPRNQQILASIVLKNLRCQPTESPASFAESCRGRIGERLVLTENDQSLRVVMETRVLGLNSLVFTFPRTHCRYRYDLNDLL